MMPNQHISTLSLRVVAINAQAYGHLRAVITLIQRLCSLGATQPIDVVCSSLEKGEALEKIKTLLGKSPDPSLGEINLRLWDPEVGPALEQVDLGFFAGIDKNEKMYIKNVNAKLIAVLQPSGWQIDRSCNNRYVISEDGILTELDVDARLSSSYLEKGLGDVSKYKAEARIIRMLKCFSKIPYQLFYGLHSWQTGYGLASDFINEPLRTDIIFNRVMLAHEHLNQRAKGCSFIFSPDQGIKVIVDFFNGKPLYSHVYSHLLRSVSGDRQFLPYIIYGDFSEQSVDGYYDFLEKVEQCVEKGLQVVFVIYTGPLQYRYFDHIFLKEQPNRYPPIIEGCNAIETCLYSGSPFISMNRRLDYLGFQHDSSIVLQSDETSYGMFPYIKLAEYMADCLNKTPEILAFHEKLKRRYGSKKDLLKSALRALGVDFSRPKVNGEIFAVSADALGRPYEAATPLEAQSAAVKIALPHGFF